MTVKQEYEKMKRELRAWNKRSNFDDTKYTHHIEHHTKKARQMFLDLLNSDFEEINFYIKHGFITTEQHNKYEKVLLDCLRSIENMTII